MASACCLLVAMSCFLIGAGIQRRVLTPRDLDLALGNFHIVGYTTNRPSCPPYGGRKPPSSAMCESDSLYAPTEFYTIWVVIPHVSSPPRTTFRRLLLLPMQ